VAIKIDINITLLSYSRSFI